MNTTKKFLALGLFLTALTSNNLVSMKGDGHQVIVLEEERAVVPGASYYTCELIDQSETAGDQRMVKRKTVFTPGEHQMIITVESPLIATCVTFYTFDGNKIKTQRLDFSDCPYHHLIDIMLDPKAPKPRPTSCLIKYRQTDDTSIRAFFDALMASFDDRVGHVICFFDQHRNLIARYSYDQKTGQIIVHASRKNMLIDRELIFDEESPPSLNNHPTIILNFPLDLSALTKEHVRTWIPEGSECIIS